jgi:titin
VSTRRAVAVFAVAVVAFATVVSASPSYAVEAPRLLGASTTVDNGFLPPSVTTRFRFAGDVVGVDATWSTGTGANQQQISSGGYQVNVGLSVFDLAFGQRSFMQAGTWTLTRVTLTGPEGLAPVVYGVGGLPLPGPAATFVLTGGPASLAELGDLAGTLTEATVTSPAVAPKTIATSGDFKATLTYGAATVGMTAFIPVATLPGAPGGPPVQRTVGGVGVGATAGTVVVGGTANASTYADGTWSLTRVLGRGGPAVRIFDKDGYTTYVQTRTDLSGYGPDCAGYLGDYTGITLDPGCRVVSTSTTSVGGLGDPTNDVTMSGMGAAPTTSPVLTGASWSTPTVAVGGTATLTTHYADAAVAPKTGQQLSAQFSSGTYKLQVDYTPTTTCTVSPPAPVSCTVSADIHVPADAFAGVYKPDWFYSVNTSGNGTYYEPGMVVTHIAGRDTTTKPVPADSLAMFGATITVTGGIATDTTPPVLSTLTRTSPAQVDTTDPVAVPAAATFHWVGSDVGTGISQVQAVLYSPAAHGYTTAGWSPTGPAVNGTSGDMTVSSYYASAPGDWVVRSVTVTDRRGNTRRYDADGTVAPGTTHAIDFATLGFSAVNAAAAAVPSAPRSLRVSGRDATLVATWAAPASAGGSPVTSYDVTLDAGYSSTIGPLTVTATTATFTGLTNATGYTVTVKAHNSAGFGPSTWAPGTSVHPVAPLIGPTIVTAPPAVIRTPVVALTAVAPATQAGAPVTGYLTQVRIAPPGKAFPTVWSNSGAIRATPSTKVGVPLGARICVRLAAVNGVGIGAVSNSRCTTVLGDERSLAASPGWKRQTVATAYNRTLSTSTRTGSSMTMVKAYGSRITIAGRAVPRGGSIAVYVGATRVATLSFAQAKAGYVTRVVTVALRGQRVILVVTKQGAGVSLDGIAVSP